MGRLFALFPIPSICASLACVFSGESEDKENGWKSDETP
jgi:hypothetical protein